MAGGRPETGRTVAALLRDLAEGSVTLVRDEARLVRLELADMLQAVGRGTALVAAGGVLAMLGGLALLTGVILLGGDQWLRDRHWLAALLIAVLTGSVAAWFAHRGRALLTPKALVPDQTLGTLKEDKEWLKRQLTSDATSR